MPTIRRLYTNEFLDYIISLLVTLQSSLNLNQIQRGNPRFLTPTDLLSTLDAIYAMPSTLAADWGPSIQSVTTEYDFRLLYIRLINTSGTDDVARSTIANVETISELLLDNKNFPTLGSLFPGLYTQGPPYTGLIPDEMTMHKVDFNPPELKQLNDSQIAADGAAMFIRVTARAYKNTL
jgi:hypothetical protein